VVLYAVPLGGPTTAGLVLQPYAVAVPTLICHLQPPLVLPEHQSHALQEALRNREVHAGGRFLVLPTGVQVWDRPFDGPGGTNGDARHLGSVDWVLDEPARGYATVRRAIVTAPGAASGQTPLSVLTDVLDAAGMRIDEGRLIAVKASRDPFRNARR
jgi:hypothetical protein